MTILTSQPRQNVSASIKKWTLDAFRALPEGPPFYELEDGELIKMAQPTILHQQLLAFLMRIIGNLLAANGMGDLYLEPELQLSDSVVYVPDFCYVAKDNVRVRVGERELIGVPDLVVEILSPSTRNRDRTKKFRAYEAAGIQHYWIIDPQDKLVWVYENSELGYLTKQIVEPNLEFSAELFPGLTIDLTSVWGELSDEKESEQNE